MTKITLFCVIFVGTFSILYLVLQNTLLHNFSSKSSKNTVILVRDNFIKMTLEPKVVIPTLPVGKGRYDNQRILRIYDFYFTGTQWESLGEKYDICFATQATLEKIYWVPYILEKWTGPLSISIQLTSEEEWLIFNLYMSYLTKCHSTFKSQVAVHLAVPANLSALKIDDKIFSQWEDISLELIWKKGQACPEAKQYLQYLLNTLPTRDFKKLAYKEVYPQNHMRNIARKGCGTHWTFLADVDIIPSNGMADLLQEFYNSQKLEGKLCEKCAYVIPSFELNYTVPFPQNKKELVEYFKNGTSQQYNGKAFAPAQDATEYSWWASTNIDQENVTISHQINMTNLKRYEPFYLSPDNIPPFDERFLGYGFTRSSQFQVAYTAGWNFSVLTPVYTVHWGFLTAKYEWPKKGGFGKPVRIEQINKNRRIYKRFVKELDCKKKIGTV